MTNNEIKNVCDILLKLNKVTEYELQNTYPEIYSKSGGYRKINMFDSVIHIYETSSNEFVDVTVGEVGKLEKLSNIKSDSGKKINCKINLGFFNFDGSKEHLGLYIDQGIIRNNYDNWYITFIYYKNGKTEIRYVDTHEWLNYWKTEAHWAIGVGYSLVKNNIINTENSSHFSHSTSKNPRTMIGQLSDQRFILAVAEGRIDTSDGLTVIEQAKVMKSLGCINAVNLDGGGSSEMIVNDKIINNLPTGCAERSIGSALTVCNI